MKNNANKKLTRREWIRISSLYGTAAIGSLMIGPASLFFTGCTGPVKYSTPEQESNIVYPLLSGKKIQAPDYGCMVGFHSSDWPDANRGGYSWLESQVGIGPKILVPPYWKMEETYTRFARGFRQLNVPERQIIHDKAIPFLYYNVSPVLAFNDLANFSNDKTFVKNFEAYAKNIKKLQRPMFFTTMEEMNGNWYPWGQKAKGFKKAWKFMHKVFEDNGANEYATWVWEVFTMFKGRGDVAYPEQYYPGDDYVDWIGVSAYRKSRYEVLNKNYGDLAGSTIANLHKVHKDKPIILSEMGSVNDSRQPSWFIDAFNYIRRRPAIKAAVIWDNINVALDYNHQVTDNSFAALKTVFQDPYFIGFRH